MLPRLKISKLSRKQISSAGLMLGALLFTGLAFRSSAPPLESNVDTSCLEIVNTETTLQSEQLNNLNLKLNQERATIRQMLGNPYCLLPKTSIRSGVITEREAYRLTDDSRAILAYEGNKLIGYALEPVKLPQSNQKEITLRQTWSLQAGESIEGHRVVSGLGDLSVALQDEVYAPADGMVYGRFVLISKGSLSHSESDCLIFSSSQLPAYLLQLCGLGKRRLGVIQQGSPLGKAQGYLHLALLRQDREWVFVPPSPELLKLLLRKP